MDTKTGWMVVGVCLVLLLVDNILTERELAVYPYPEVNEDTDISPLSSRDTRHSHHTHSRQMAAMSLTRRQHTSRKPEQAHNDDNGQVVEVLERLLILLQKQD
ncbi:hypothetical protein LSAT2_008839 [Lamellibrachia satsuma]|nr:hypothetical protein LSAT2_008839 [Lamellibrachia satsuma]